MSETPNTPTPPPSITPSSSPTNVPSFYPDKHKSDAITLNDFYSSLHYSEPTLDAQQVGVYKTWEIINYCHQQAVKIVGDVKMGQTNFIEKLCTVSLLKGSGCLNKFVSFNAEETPNRLNSSAKDYGQFYYNLMHCQEKDEETKRMYQEVLVEREQVSNDDCKLKDNFTHVHKNLTLQNNAEIREIFKKVDANSEDRTKLLFDEVSQKFAQTQYENLRKCAKERYFTSSHVEDTFGYSENNINELAHKCYVPYMEYFTRVGSVLCRRQLGNCLSLGLKKQKHNIDNATFFYLNTCMSDDAMVASCMKYPEQYFINKLED